MPIYKGMMSSNNSTTNKTNTVSTVSGTVKSRLAALPIFTTSVNGIFYSIETDGSYLYMSGIRYVSGINYLSVEKRLISNGSIVDQADFLPMGTAGGLYSCKVDSSNVYAGGYYTSAATQYAIIYKLNKNNLSLIVWTYTYSVTPYVIDDLCLDTNNVYFTGYYYGGGLVLKGKLQKSDGAQLWVFNNTSTQGYGISRDTSYIYIHKHQGGICAVEKVNPTDGTVLGTSTYSAGAFLRGEITNNYLYVAGFLNTPYTMAKALIEKTIPGNASQWQKTHGPDAPNEQNEYYTAVCDGADTYVVGRAPYSPTQTARMARYAVSDGTEVWGIDHPTITRRSITLCQFNSYIYIVGWDVASTPSTFYLECRNKSNGNLVWEVTS